MENTQASVDSTTSTPAEVSTPTTAVEAISTQSSGEVKVETPAYTPNYKYKVHDKEYEFDEFVRGAIKDAESEKKLRDLYERSRGLDEVKLKRDKINEEFSTYKNNTSPVLDVYTKASQSYQKGLQALKSGNAYNAAAYLDEAFGALGVPEEVIQRYVFHKLEMKDLPPNLQQQYTRNVELERQNNSLQQQMEMAQAQQQQLKVQQRQFELQQSLAKPEISSIAQAFDQRSGQNAFSQAVWNFAALHYQRTGEDLSADQATQMFVQQFGLQAPTPVSTPQSQVVQPGQVPVIPVVKGGSNASPAKRKISSLQDLERAYQES